VETLWHLRVLSHEVQLRRCAAGKGAEPWWLPEASQPAPVDQFEGDEVEEEADGGDEGCGGAEQQVDGNDQNDEEESCLVPFLSPACATSPVVRRALTSHFSDSRDTERFATSSHSNYHTSHCYSLRG
jgi:hypothetical protein